MKNFIHILILVAVTTSFSSCKKWLDVQISTQLSNKDLFKNEEGFSLALNGTYGALTATGLYGREMTFGAMDVLAGYYRPNYSMTLTYSNLYYNYPYKRNNPNKDNAAVAMIDAMWTGLYNQVSNLNNMLSEIDGKKEVFTKDHYRLLKGEALGLRAFIHLDLLRMYGPSYEVNPAAKSIPYVDTLSSLVMPLLTVEEASNRIIVDLKAALDLMENDPIRLGTPPTAILASNRPSTALAVYHNRRYHFNYYAVKAALARIYLWKGDKPNALKYAKEVIADQAARFPWVLDANLSAIQTPSAANKDRTFTTEHIFALNVRALAEYVPTYLQGAGMDVGLFLPTANSVRNNIYENNTVDPRNQYLFVPTSSNFYSSKLYQDEIVSPWFKFQIPMIRISEMFYIAAESEPAIADGLNWLNTVRTARKLTPLLAGNITTTAAFQREIQKEYQKEFICEGQLWFYYKRQNMESLPYATSFWETETYVFDMPEDEYLYGGRQ